MNNSIEMKEMVERRMQAAIDKHGPNAKQSILDLMEKQRMARDFIVPVKDLYFGPGSGNSGVAMTFSDIEKGRGIVADLHENAIEQLGGRFEVPAMYLKRLSSSNEPWKPSLAAHTLTAFSQNGGKKDTVLVRCSGDRCLAVLSNKYRRLNMVQIFGSFAKEAQRAGAILYNGVCGDLTSYLEVVVPRMHEIQTPNNGTLYMAFGAHIRSSDYGRSSLELRQFSLQGWCANGLIGQSIRRDVHLGRRLEANDFAFSKRTYELDTQTVMSAIGDVMRQILSDESIEESIRAIRHASAKEIDMQQAIIELPKVGITQEEADRIEAILMGSDPDDGVQGKPTKLKLMCAITAAAREALPVRSREMQEIAAKVCLN